MTTRHRARRKGAPSAEPPSLQAQLEGTGSGRLLISALIVWSLAALLVSNLPPSELEETARPAVAPLLEAAALSQTWNLFAPDPRRSTLRFEARLAYADGSQLTWHPPDGDPFISEYRSYRWRKWATNTMSDRRADMWPEIARWLAEQHRRDGQLPTEVILVRQFYFAPAPGSGERSVPAWSDDVLYVARYPEAQ
jgi:hypothetical protein